MEELVIKTKHGDKEAYSELIASMYSDLYNFALSKSSNEADAQDAIQETIIAAYLGIKKLKNPKKFKSWILKILTRECAKTYKKYQNKDNSELSDNIPSPNNSIGLIDDKFDFDAIIKSLNETEKKILELHYDDGLSIKQIAKHLNLNENTVKTKLYRSLGKVRKVYKGTTVFMFILCILIASSVIAVSIISYIKHLFNTSNAGIQNPGVMMAIEHKDWFQETKMDYIDLGDGYKVRVEYLIMDEMCLYLAFDFVSENEDLSKYTDIVMPDLVITDENGEVIYNASGIRVDQYAQASNSSLIEITSNTIKELLFLYSNSFPHSKTLNMTFSKIHLYGNGTKYKLNADINLQIDLLGKFVNRSYSTYISNSSEIDKSIISETGFYTIFKNSTGSKPLKTKLIDEFNNEYPCFVIEFNYDVTSNTYDQLVTASFTNSENKKLKLIIDNTEYELIKKE